MGSIYRVVVDSSKRLSGSIGMNNFSINVGNTFSTRDFLEHQYMCVVENTSLVSYSATSSTFAGAANGPRCLTITCPQLAYTNGYESFRGQDDSSTLVALQAYCTSNAPTGVFGINHDTPYARRAHLGTLVKSELLQKAGRLDIVVKTIGLAGVNPCSTPNNTTVWGNNWSMTLVFFPVDVAEPEYPIAQYYDFHKIWLNTFNRTNWASTTLANIEMPIRYSTHGAMSIPGSRWFINVEFCSPFFYASSTLPQCVYLTTTWMNPSSSGPLTLCMLNRSFRSTEQGHFGARYSILPTARDHVGIPAPLTLDSLSTLKLQLRDHTGAMLTGSLIPPSELLICLTFYRVYS